MNYLLDTHIWIWSNLQPRSLSSRTRALIESGEYEELLLSQISIWEFSKLVQKGRLSISIDGLKWIETALEIPRLRVVGVTPEIAWQSTRLPPPFHEDPADQIIVATARSENATLITSDQALIRYPHVRTL